MACLKYGLTIHSVDLVIGFTLTGHAALTAPMPNESRVGEHTHIRNFITVNGFYMIFR